VCEHDAPSYDLGVFSGPVWRTFVRRFPQLAATPPAVSRGTPAGGEGPPRCEGSGPTCLGPFKFLGLRTCYLYGSANRNVSNDLFQRVGPIYRLIPCCFSLFPFSPFADVGKEAPLEFVFFSQIMTSPRKPILVGPDPAPNRGWNSYELFFPFSLFFVA